MFQVSGIRSMPIDSCGPLACLNDLKYLAPIPIQGWFHWKDGFIGRTFMYYLTDLVCGHNGRPVCTN